MREVIVLGKGSLAVKVCNWFLRSADYRLVLIVPVMPEPSWTESLCRWATGNAVPFVESGHYKDIPGVGEGDWSIDLAFSVFYDKIIKPWFIDKCGRMLNFHNSPLPRYRGVRPINWALKNQEREHGVTIHEITPGIDDGPIVGQVKFSIYPEFDEVIDVYNRALEYGWLLFQQTLPILDKITPIPQDESQATYYGQERVSLLGDRSDFTKDESMRNRCRADGE